MKYYNLILALFMMLLFTSCKEYEFNNPWEPGIPVKEPSELAVTSFTDSTISLKWKDNSNNETAFVLEEAVGSIGYKTVNEFNANSTATTFSFPVRAHISYRFRIKAKNNAEESAYSNETSLALSGYNISDLCLNKVDGGNLTFGWNDDIPVPHSLELYSSNDNSTFTLLSSINSGTNSVTVPFSLVSGNNYYFHMQCKTGFSTEKLPSIKVFKENKIFIGGNTSYDVNGGTSYNLTSVSGNTWTKYNVKSCVKTTEYYHGYYYVGGVLGNCDGVQNNMIGRMKAGKWISTTGVSDTVLCLKSYNDLLFAGGCFNADNKSTILNYIGMWNGLKWSAVGTGMNDKVLCFEIFNNMLIAGGQFTTAGGVTVNRIAMWNGSSWQPMDAGFDGTVRALAVYKNELYAAGDFNYAGATPASKIAKWDGSKWVSVQSGNSGSIYTLTSDLNFLYAGGKFTTEGIPSINNIVFWDGINWRAWSAAYGTVYALCSYNNLLYAGGNMYVLRSGSTRKDNFAIYNGNWDSPIFTYGEVYTIKSLDNWISQ